MNEPISHEEFQRYLDLLGGLLRLGSSRRASVTDELKTHLEERFMALTSEGVEPGEAISMALAEFGDVAALAAEFSAANRLRQRRWMMRITVGSLTACVVALFVALTFLPGGDPNLAPEAAFAQAPVNEPEKKSTERALELLPADLDSKLEPPADLDSKPVATNAQEDPNTVALAKLQNKIPIEFNDTPLRDATQHLSDALGLQFYIDKRALDDVGMSDESPVTINLRDIPAEMGLRLLLDQLDLSFMPDHGVIIVTTPERIETTLKTKCYPIGDLETIERTSDSMRGMGDRSRSNTTEDLIKLIQDSVQPSSWAQVGGCGSIVAFRNVLVIQQTWHAHRNIEMLLKQLRGTLDPKSSTVGTSPIFLPQRQTFPTTPLKHGVPSFRRPVIMLPSDEPSKPAKPAADDPFGVEPSKPATANPFGDGSPVKDKPKAKPAADDPFGAAAVEDKDKSALSKISGTVTLDGKPLTGARIQFIPTSPKGSPSSGPTNKSGNFELQAQPGTYQVQINKNQPDGSLQSKTGNIPLHPLAEWGKKSELRAEIQPGSNLIDFSLDSE